MEEKEMLKSIELNPELSEEERQEEAEEAAWDAVATRLMLKAEAEAKRPKTVCREAAEIEQGLPQCG